MSAPRQVQSVGSGVSPLSVGCFKIMTTRDQYQRQFFLQAERERILGSFALAHSWFSILWRSRKWIVAGLSAGVLMAAANLTLAPVVYESTVTIRVAKPPAELIPVHDSGSSPQFYSMPY